MRRTILARYDDVESDLFGERRRVALRGLVLLLSLALLVSSGMNGRSGNASYFAFLPPQSKKGVSIQHRAPHTGLKTDCTG